MNKNPTYLEFVQQYLKEQVCIDDNKNQCIKIIYSTGTSSDSIAVGYDSISYGINNPNERHTETLFSRIKDIIYNRIRVKILEEEFKKYTEGNYSMLYVTPDNEKDAMVIVPEMCMPKNNLKLIFMHPETYKELRNKIMYPIK